MDPILTNYYRMYFETIRLLEDYKKQQDFPNEKAAALQELRIENLIDRSKLLEEFIGTYTDILKKGIK